MKGNGPKTGPAIILTVMAGDVIKVGVYYYYNSEAASPTSPLVPQNLLNSLASGLATISSVAREGITTLGNSSSSPLLGALTSSISNDTGTVTSKPQAYLNWMSLDNQFNYVANQSGAQQVGAAGLQNGALQTPLAQTITILKSGYMYIYVSNATPGWDVFFDNLSIMHYSGPLMEENHYYPFGLTMAGISDKALKSNYAENKYRFNKKELQNKEFSDGSGLEEYDYGARFYDQQIGRWQKLDGKAELYFATSPYAYALNQPTNAIDPDGNLVIFVNGNYFGFSTPGADYWHTTEYKTDPNRSTILNPQGGYYAPRNFDQEVMNHLGDQNARYYDGSLGGNHPLIDYTTPTIGASSAGREAAGYAQGNLDAKTIIDNLARDKSGNITETIKIITHSMGGSYGHGFLKALKDYIATLPKEQQAQIKISFIADFDPYQGGDITADGQTPTFQFMHKNSWNITGLGWLANEEEKGQVEQVAPDKNDDSDHSIFSFFNDISQLAEGTYKWDAKNKKWVKQ